MRTSRGSQVPSSVRTEAAEWGRGFTLAAPEGVVTTGLWAVLRGGGPPPELDEGGLFLAIPSGRDIVSSGREGRGIRCVALERVSAQVALGVRGAAASAGVLPDLQHPRWGSVERGLHRESPMGRATATSHG